MDIIHTDVGLALHLAGLAEPTGAHLENLVLSDLVCWRDARAERAEILYWRSGTRPGRAGESPSGASSFRPTKGALVFTPGSE